MSDQSAKSLYGDSIPNPDEQIKPLGLMDIISGVFSEPVDLFRHLSKRPQWVGAMLLAVVLTTVFSVAWALKVDAVEFMLSAFERAAPSSPQLQQMSSAQLEQTAEMQAKLLPVFSAFGGLFVNPVFIFLLGLLYWVIGLISREEPQQKPTYFHGLVVASVPGLVTIPYLLLGTIMALVNPVGTLRANQIVPSSLAYWLETENPKLSTLYSSLDLFLLAQYVMIFFAARYAMRTKTWGAVLCVALALLFPCYGIWAAK